MLDAFARGVPVVAMKRATANLPIGDACVVVPNDSPGALARATAELLATKVANRAYAEAGSRYLATNHSDQAYVTAMRAWLGGSSAIRPKAMRRAPHPPTEPARRAP